MDKLNYKLCTGCGACYNACPNDAITMQENEKGFLKPIINRGKCINCNRCINVCPLNNYQSINIEFPQVYSMVNKNDKIRLKSSSGGLFYLLAEQIFNKNGIVFGCVWDEDMKTSQIAANSINEIDKMHGSKYVQSDTKKTFAEAKEYLIQGKQVLYVGTPCQIAGLTNFLGKNYENLYTIDLICHGIPSRKLFEMFKKEYCKKNGIKGKIIDINMRSKRTEWGKPFTTVITTSDSEYIIPFEENDFLESFLHNYNINDSCLECKFNALPRTGDITIGDFCGVDEYDKSLNDKKGISILLINSKKGDFLFNGINEYCKIQELQLKDAAKYNKNILSSSIPNVFRDKFFNYIMWGKSLHDSMENSKNTYPKLLKILFKLQPEFIKKIIKRFI